MPDILHPASFDRVTGAEHLTAGELVHVTLIGRVRRVEGGAFTLDLEGVPWGDMHDFGHESLLRVPAPAVVRVELSPHELVEVVERRASAARRAAMLRDAS